VREVFGQTIDYATEIKVLGKDGISRNQRYNPVKVVAIKRETRLGNPDMDFATTCHAERTNLNARTFTRRLTRCTLGYSKNWKTCAMQSPCSFVISISAVCIPHTRKRPHNRRD
jgi:hypothetical protein